MATDHQVALSRPPRLPTSNVSKSARQAVPAFLQKLYEMVNDPKTEDVIRWSAAGDSFFVLDQERLSREVLGRWFKHQNFSSFVRQLNMYGFHKIPHLQQGVLRSETDTELWNFINPNFHRGQPDLLCLIQRKKQAAQLSDDFPADTNDSNAPPSPNSGQSQGQVLDINSLVQGIAAIKRHQTTISSELNELKRSNQLLWQDALTARARHQKQQDTINRILKFLAGVFGNHAAGNHHKDDVADSPSPNHHAVVPRRRTRLMIEGAQHELSGKVGIIEVEDPEASSTESSSFSNTAYPYPTIETPASVPSPAPSVAQSDGTGPTISEASHFGSINPSFVSHSTTEDSRATNPTPSLNHQPPKSDDNPNTAPSPNNALERAVTPNRSPAYEVDSRVQHILNNLSPDQITQLVNSLSQTMADTDYTQDQQQTVDSSHHWFQQHNFDYAQPPTPPPPFPLLPPLAPPTSTAEDGLIAFDNLHVDPVGLSQALERNWQATEDIDKEVNSMNTHINSIIETLGLNPSLLHGADPDSSSSLPPTMIGNGTHSSSNNNNPPTVPPLSDIPGISDPDTNASGDLGGVGHDFDFDSFLDTFSNTAAGGSGTGTGTGAGQGVDIIDYNDSASTAFLDEVPSPSDGTASPVTYIQRPTSPMHSTPTATTAATPAKTGRKRKSDVVVSELESALGAARMSETFAKTKRRKD